MRNVQGIARILRNTQERTVMGIHGSADDFRGPAIRLVASDQDDSLPDRVAYEIAESGHLQLFHDLTAVQFDPPRADAYLRRNFPAV